MVRLMSGTEEVKEVDVLDYKPSDLRRYCKHKVRKEKKS
jgi:hypothetical protein